MAESAVGKVFDLGVDYITCTWSRNSAGLDAGKRAVRLVRAEVKAGNREKPWGMAGYQGSCAGSVQNGQGDQGVIVRLSGEAAKDHWAKFAQTCEGCSRLDLQITVRFPCAESAIVRRLYRRLKRGSKGDGKNRTLSLYQSSNGSATIYLGQRVSENYGRIYAKGAETKLDFWKDSVRFEAEFKGDTARREMLSLLYSGNREHHVLGRVYEFFSDRGARPRLDGVTLGGNVLPGVLLTSQAGTGWTRSLSESKRQLQWLRDSICPTVARLLEIEGRNEVFNALGISQYVENGAAGPKATNKL
jgi:hypothetical protein